MKKYHAGPYDIDVRISGDGPFRARAFVRPQNSLKVLEYADAEGETAEAAEAAAVEGARAAAVGLPNDRRYVD